MRPTLSTMRHLFMGRAVCPGPTLVPFFRGWAARSGGAFDRAGIDNGQVWRLLTAHFVRLNALHLALNLLGLAGVMGVWGWVLARPAALLGMFLGSALAVNLGLWILEADLGYYAEACGALHGLFAAGIVLSTSCRWAFRATAALGFLLKLVLEVHIRTGTAGLIGTLVIHAARQFGALGGILSALIWHFWHRARRRASPARYLPRRPAELVTNWVEN